MTALSRRLWAHMRALWPRYTLLPPLPFVAWWLFSVARGERRWELALAALVPIVLSYTSEATKRLYVNTIPIFMVGLFYDAMGFFQNVGLSPERIHVCDLHDLDARLFGLTVDGLPMAWPDWFRAHQWLGLDVYCAIPYGTFIYVSIAYAVYLYWTDPGALNRFAWAFMLVNFAGFATYHLVPAAPPWYFHAHGCAVDMSTHASEGPALARVDALLGIQYFHGFYGRSHDVFGAVPSLHVAYPMLIVLEGWRRHGIVGRSLSVLFFVSMAFAAVYLDHHWVTDVLLGVTYTVSSFWVVRWVWFRLTRVSPAVLHRLPPLVSSPVVDTIRADGRQAPVGLDLKEG